MKFSVNRTDLALALVDVNRALPAKSEKTVLENICLLADDNGLSLTSSDGTMSITACAKAEVSDGGKLLVPGKLFTDIVRRLPDAEMKCTVTKTTNSNGQEVNTMRIVCGSSKANITCLEDDYPETPDMSHVPPFHMDKTILTDMISKVAFAASVQDSRPMLTGVNMEMSSNELRLVALDGFRLALQVRHEEFILPDGVEKISAVIPGKAISTLCAIMEASAENAVTLRIQGENMSASIGGTEFVAGLLAGEFIQYRQLLPNSFATRVKVNRRDFQDAVNRAAIIAQEGKNNLVKLDADRDVLHITSNSEIGDDHEELAAFVEGNNITIAFNARYLNDVVRYTEDEDLLLCMNTNVSPCVVMPENGDSYLYLILPVRVYN